MLHQPMLGYRLKLNMHLLSSIMSFGCLMGPDAPASADSRFQHTGLERAGPVGTDIDDLVTEYNLQKPEPAADGPGNNYAK